MKTTPRQILADLSGMPIEKILDTMSVRHDLGLHPIDVCEALRHQGFGLQLSIITDPAALVSDVERGVL